MINLIEKGKPLFPPPHARKIVVDQLNTITHPSRTTHGNIHDNNTLSQYLAYPYQISKKSRISQIIGELARLAEPHQLEKYEHSFSCL